MDLSQVKKRHGIIDSFLQMLFSAKGETGKLDLCTIHWQPENPGTRGFISAGSCLAKGFQAATVKLEPTEKIEFQKDDHLTIGERIEFHGKVPCDGYIHLFDLGTSGSCDKLAPSKEYNSNYEPAGSVFKIPSDKYFDIPNEQFGVTGPTSSESGKPERLLVILTIDDIDLQIEDLHPKLEGREFFTRCASKGPSFGSPVKSDTAKLFRIPKDRWDYGLLVIDVR